MNRRLLKEEARPGRVHFALSMVFALVAIALFIGSVYFAVAAPSGGVVTYVSNSTNNGSTASSRNDSGGYIYYVNINTIQQNTNWKAYVGNITGQLTLDDANSYTIYNWDVSITSGEVLISRAASPAFSTLNCSNQSIIASENNFFGYSGVAPDNINKTFNLTNHSIFQIGAVSIPINTCSSQLLFVNDTRPAVSIAASWQEILLSDTSNNLVYATKISDATIAFNNRTHDFQMIVAENGSSSVTTTYYFFAEIV